MTKIDAKTNKPFAFVCYEEHISAKNALENL
jgi:RNA recognition motif-containing protein